MRPILRYHGGKWKLSSWIISHFPEHDVYVEPFCGAASVLMRKPVSRVEVLNDRYARLVNVFSVLRDPILSAQLAELLRFTPFAFSEYYACREQSSDPVEDARRMIVLGFQSHGSTASAGGKFSGWRRSARSSGPSCAQEWSDVWKQVLLWADRLRRVSLENTDAFSLFSRWDGPATLFYVDPPYLACTRTPSSSYAFEMTEEEHCRLADVLRSLEGMVVLSGYHSELYASLYSDWFSVSRTALADKGKVCTEYLWLNFRPHVRTGLFDFCPAAA